MKNIINFLTELFTNWGFNEKLITISLTITLFVGLLIISWIANIITKQIIVRVVKAIIKKTKSEYDDIFVQKGVFDNLSHLIPALIIYFGVPLTSSSETFISIVRDFTYIYIIIAVLVVLNKVLNALNDIYEIYAEKRQIKLHIKQFIQVVKIILIILGVILIVSVLFHKKPGAIIAGLGAMTAVLMLIFRDSILSFVAGIQLTAYQMVKEGDWITVPSRGVDGDVMDISLNTIKVRNFDKTISTIPTYALVQESFINWKGMEEAGGRRIKRAIFIDMTSIKIPSEELLNKLEKLDLIKDLIANIKTKEKNNSLYLLNNETITNLTLFRRYIENYIKANYKVYKKYKKHKFVLNGTVVEKFVIDDVEDFKKELGREADYFLAQSNGLTYIKDTNKFLIRFNDKFVLENNYLYKIKKTHKVVIKKGTEVVVETFEKILLKDGIFRDDLTFLVRQLPPTEKGLPVEIYVFAATISWVEYEQIQAALIEHLLAMLPIFELRPFQLVSGADLKVFKG